MLGNYKVLVAVAIGALVIIAIWTKVKKSKEKELKMIAEDKLRDQALDRKSVW